MNTHDLLARSRELDEGKNDFYVPANEVSWEGGGYLHLAVPNETLFNNTWMSFRVTDHALGQACAKAGPPPANYIRKCSPELAATNMNYWTQALDKEWMVRTHGIHARAVVSGLYAPVENTFILETLDEFIRGEPRPVIGGVTADTLHARVLFGAKDINIPGFGEENYANGLYLANSEIGTSSVKILPFVMRTSCTNSTIWMSEEYGMTQKHLGKSLRYTIRAIIKEKLGSIFEASDELLHRICEAEIEQIPDPFPIIDSILSTNGYNDIRDYVIDGMEGRHSRAGIHHGLSYAANQIEDPSRQERLQLIAGSYLFGQRVAVEEGEA